jgi:hypothetical protein
MDFPFQQSNLSTIFNVFPEENHQIKILNEEVLNNENQYLEYFTENLIRLLPLGKVEEVVIQEETFTLHLFLRDKNLQGYNTDKLFLRN